MQLKISVFVYIYSSLICFFPKANAQPSGSQKDPFYQASELHRPVLLIFSGSDWCLPCLWLEKKIFNDSAFKSYADENLVLFKADFPQKKKLSPLRVSMNEKLAEEFNPDGIFPLVLLLGPDRTVLTLLEYVNYTPDHFIDQIKTVLLSENMLKEYASKARLMGSAFEFIVTANNNREGNALLLECNAEVQRIEKLLSEFRDDSETSLINRHAGKKAVEVSEETYSLLQRSNNISLMTQGAFDITSGILKKLYAFKKREIKLPADEMVSNALQKTGFRKIKLLGNNKVHLANTGMHIGFGAIGKGYAADKVKKMMEDKGVEGGVVNASGDLTAWGKRPDGEPWKAGISNPDNISSAILWLPLNNVSIATSGDYEQYFEVNKIRYSHNIDPKTGLPVRGIKSVSVISPGAELSDALATAVTVMGVEAGLHMINQLPHTHCIIVDDKNKLFSSDKININITA